MARTLFLGSRMPASTCASCLIGPGKVVIPHAHGEAKVAPAPKNQEEHKMTIFTRLTALLALVLGALGCGHGSDPTGGTASASNSSAPAAVRIGYFANLSHAQAVLGVASGEFAKAVAPSKLETKLFNAGPSVVEAIFAGELDLAYIGPGPAISGYSKSRGQGLVVVGAAAANGVAIVARPGSGIEKLEDLAGKRLATPQLGNTQDIAARHFLATVLKQPDLKNVVPVPNAEQAGLMSRGEIDAAWAPEPWAERLVQEAGAKVIGEEKELWKGGQFTLTYIVASPEFVKQHRAVIERVLSVHRSFTEKLTSDAAGQVGPLGDALFALNGKRLPEGVLAKAITRVKFIDTPDIETLDTLATWSFDLGFEKTRPDLATMIDPSFAKK